MTAIALLGTSLGILTVAGIILLCCRRRNPPAGWLPAVTMILTVFTASIIPIVYGAASGELDELSLGVGSGTWLYGAIIEFAFVLALLYGLLLAPALHTRWPDRLANRLKSSPDQWWTLSVVCVASFLLVSVLGGSADYRYADANSILLSGGTTSTSGGGLSRLLLGSLVAPTAVLAVCSRRPIGRLALLAKLFILVVVLVPYVLRSVAFGARGLPVTIGIMFCSVWILRGRKQRAFLSFGALAVLLVLASPGIRSYRTETFLDRESTLAQRLGVLAEAVQRTEESPGSSGGLSSTLARFDTVQNGGLLAEHADGEGKYAGAQPFLGAVLAPVPRSLLPGKPVPLSSTGDIRGEPHFLAASLRGQPYNSVGVSASGIAYWQFSWFGLIATGLINGLILVWLGRALLAGGLIGQALYLIIGAQVSFLLAVPLDMWVMVVSRTLVAFTACALIKHCLTGLATRRNVRVPV